MNNTRLEKNSAAVKKRIEQHTFEDEEGEEYKASSFGGFPEYFRRKKIKLQNLDVELRSRSTNNPQIFRGVVAHGNIDLKNPCSILDWAHWANEKAVNGYTQPSLNDLHHMIVSHGGGFLQYLDGKTMVTHIIASNLTPKKVVEFKRYRIVKPAWVVDSISAGKLLPWNSYRLVDEGERQKVLKISNGKIGTQASDLRKGYREQTDASWYNQQLKEEAEKESHSQLQTSGEISSLDPDAVEEIFARLDNQDKSHDEVPESVPSPVGTLIQPGEFSDDKEQLYGQVEYYAGAEQEHIKANDRASEYTLDDRKEAATNAAAEENPFQESEGTSKRKVDLKNQCESTKKQRLMTAEEHNTILLADPYVRKSSTLNPDFLEQYYRESRLHHLSTWKAELKSRLQALTASKSSSQKAQPKRPPGARRYILHVDFDSFFVAVSLKTHPHLIDKPACVAHGKGSGSEIASCNYPAREFGVKNGMWMKRALELCKDLKVLPYNFPAYEEASRLFYEAILATDGIVQSVSIDEALVDITSFCLAAGGTNGTGVQEGSIWREQNEADKIAQHIRDQIWKDTGCNVSVGIGNNILLAKVALRKAKPAGQHQIKPEDVLEFLGPLEVQTLPGIAYSIGGRLEEHGIKFVKDIRDMTKERLISILGPKTGDKIWNYARGIDKTEVGDQVIRKSVSAEINWGVRFETVEQAEEFVESLCGELNRRLLKEGVNGRQLTMKIMRRAADAPLDPPKHLGHGKCDTFNKSVVLGVATNSKDIIAKHAISIMRSYNFSPGELRGLGVQMTKLEPLNKAVNDGDASDNATGAQRRLQFKPEVEAPKSNSRMSVEQQTTVDITPAHQISATDDKPPPLTKQSGDRSGPSGSQRFKGTKNAKQFPSARANGDEKDSIQDLPETPRKPRFQTESTISIPFKPVGYSDEDNSPSRKPLNTLGTQFILPTQVDAEVLAELPKDIRSRLARNRTRKPTDASLAGEAGIPSESQLDPDALAALPEDLRAEILAEYQQGGPNSRPRSPQSKVPTVAAGAQTILPQSPRKNRTIVSAAPSRRPRGRPRGSSSLLSRLRANRDLGGVDANNTLTQSNFVTPAAFTDALAGRVAGTSDIDTDTETNASKPSAEFLAALPEDIRKEVLAQQRAEQLRRTGNLVFSRRRGVGRPPGRGRGLSRAAALAARSATEQKQQQPYQRGREIVVTLPARPARPTFTRKKLWKPDDLRNAISAWYTEFKDEGPYDEDVEALEAYLRQVIDDGEQGESDLDKAVKIAKWLAFVIEEDDIPEDAASAANTTAITIAARGSWKRALAKVRQSVQKAIKARGLGAVDL